MKIDVNDIKFKSLNLKLFLKLLKLFKINPVKYNINPVPDMLNIIEVE